ncbi:MAG TPA: hypothetical protein VFO73_09425 [Candidatus Limnocylindrales bacterium]|nr:hypothetical protein [Candidatus Limnocylindrales bacterium]
MTALSIIVRHVEDADEGGLVCHDCGRPWPCDVRRLVDAMAAEAHVFAAASAFGRSPTIARPRSRRAALRVPVA